jgi:hypothetical protein
VVDCSGLMFPGHGTPTCIVFGRNQNPMEKMAIRITATLPGGGDLRTPPEESPLWQAIAAHQDEPGYADTRITVADRPRRGMAKWPWNLESAAEETRKEMDKSPIRLADLIEGEVGVCTMTNCDEVFPLLPDQARRNRIPPSLLRVFQEGDSIRNWSLDSNWLVLTPYDTKSQPLSEDRLGAALDYLKPHKRFLEDRLSFGNKTFKQLGRPWYSFERMNTNKYSTPLFITLCEIATHGHFVFWEQPRVYKQTTQTVKLPITYANVDHHLLAGLLNSSAALFWLKQVCFSKRESAEGTTDTYFVFAGGKVQQLPVPNVVTDALRGKRSEMADRLQAFSQACWERGRQMPALAIKKLFEKPGEAYYDWNSSLSGHVAPDPRPAQPFQTSENLKDAFSRACQIREGLRAEMIALQEEMDWLVYGAYGLIGGPCSVMAANADMATDVTGHVDATERVPPMMREQRPFVLWANADGDFEKAVALIPADWPDERQALWRARLEAIRDNEHIRRIEQPVYKRRWDEQWKVGNRWQCGPVAYDAEFVDAFDWWLSEKAEWWLEKKKNGGPVTLDQWTAALQQDPRVQAAWSVAHEALGRLGKRADFDRYFSALVKEQTAPDDIPAAVPWDELEKKRKIPATVKRIRGKLNVPRERFRVTASGGYVWAGVK